MGDQRTFASIEWSGKGKSNPARAVPGRDGCSDSLAAAGPADRAALPESRTRTAAAGTGEDVADLLLAAMVQPVGPTGRRRDLRQRVDAALCTGRAGRRDGAGRDHDFALSPSAGAAWADPSDLQFDHRVAERTAAVAALGNHRGRDHNRSAEFDQERQCGPRPGDEAHPQGPQLAL